jgi:glycosyltransferase involved in cell wall biosynthesis
MRAAPAASLYAAAMSVAAQSHRPGVSDRTLILLPGRDMLSKHGGSESYVAAHAKAAMMAGFEPHLFTVARSPSVLETDFGVIHRIGSRLAPRMLGARVFRRELVRAVTGFLDGHPGPHILHGFGGWADAAVAGARMLSGRGLTAVPVVTVWSTVEHEAWGKVKDPMVRTSFGPLARYLLEYVWVQCVAAPWEHRAYRACAEVVVNYDSVRVLLEQAVGRGLPITRLPYAAPLAFRDPLPTPPLPEPLVSFGDRDAPLIVSTSRHDGRKGLDVLICALARLRDAGLSFRACLVGTGLMLDAHRRLVRSLGLEGRVLLPGVVPDVLPYLAHADVFVLPSIEEGSGAVSVLEALQCSAPIVASAIDGIPEDLTDGHDALLVPPGEVEPLARALERLLSSPERRGRMRARARATFERRFTAQHATRAVAELYAGLGAAHSSRTRLARTASAT